MKFLNAVCACAAMVACVDVVRADQVILFPSKDNTLYQSTTGDLSNGSGTGLFVGSPTGNGPRRALIAFDLSVFPADVTITRVELRMYMSRTRNGNQLVSLHKVLADWGEGASVAPGNGGGGGPSAAGDATWIHRFYPGTRWTSAGGDFATAVSGSVTIGSGADFYSWVAPGMVSDVSAWIASPATNFGWIITAPESSGTAKRFESRESTNPDYVPRLIVDYTPGSGTLGACCVESTCIRTTQASCAIQGGLYQGNGSTCTGVHCGPPTGACCIHDMGTCSIRTQADCESMGGAYAGDNTTCDTAQCSPNLTPFVDALPIMPIKQPTSGTPGGAATYDIAVRQFTGSLHRDLPPTKLWGYDGQFPGPTILATVDQPVVVNWMNDLRDENGELLMEHALHVDECLHGPDHHGPVPRTVTHLHGAHTDELSDGYPEYTQMPGETSPPYVYPNHQRAGTLWYHDHALGITRLNVYMGLAGAYVLRDPVESTINLPSGEYEVPLVIQDRSFNLDGSLRYAHMWHEHFFGEFILVNGKVWPYMDVKRGKYRFRILNGSGSRVYQLSLSNGSPIYQVGTDHGLLPAPVSRSSILLSPGERADVVIDFGRFLAGGEVSLLNSAPAPYPGTPGVGVVPNVMKFRILAPTGHTAALPTSLRTYERLLESNANTSRSMSLAQEPDECTGTRWMIDGRMWDDITEFPYVGHTEVWSFVNRSAMSHPMHLHHSPLQILDRQNFTIVSGEVVPSGNRLSPPPYEMGWKDTVRADPNQITRVIVRFDDYAGLFPYHCHILEHEDNEMMRQMQIVRCAADFNEDGGVDGADVEAFYLTWEAGDSGADINRDGGVDGADVEAFFLVWQAGGC